MTAQQLKASILQLAIQGKLVPQNPADEPASVLLKKIKAEKDALVKAGKLKKDKHESVIIRGEDGRYLEKKDGKTTDITDEIPFDIPESWAWVRLGTLVNKLTDGTHFTPKYTKTGIPFLSVKDISSGRICFETAKHISEAEHKVLYQRCNPQKDDILLTKVGTTGIPVLVDCETEFSLFVSVALLKFSKDNINKRFLVSLLQSPLVQEQCAVNTRGVGNKNWVMKDIAQTLLILPPLEEQARIVAKIEELLPHVAEYRKAETELSKLNAELPEQLKKSILQWAIQGRLVPQDPNDEPASELLKRIKAEKAALIKSGKLKKEKPLPPISEDEIPFDIPESWIWVRCGDVFQHNTGKALNSTNRNGRLLEYITTSNLYWNRFELDKLRKMYFSDAEIEKCTARKGDLLVCEGGDYGRAAIWNFNRPICIQNHIHRLRSFVPVSTKFFYYLFLFYKSAGLIGGKGIGIQGLSSNALHALIFPLPPLAEQKRIVEKLESALSPLDTKEIL